MRLKRPSACRGPEPFHLHGMRGRDHILPLECQVVFEKHSSKLGLSLQGPAGVPAYLMTLHTSRENAHAVLKIQPSVHAQSWHTKHVSTGCYIWGMRMLRDFDAKHTDRRRSILLTRDKHESPQSK